MKKPQGYAFFSGADGQIKEWDTITCSHCNTIHFVKPYQDAADLGGFCRMCMKYVCGPCADLGICVPYERKLEQLERSVRLK